jgi:hypothetical protein
MDCFAYYVGPGHTPVLYAGTEVVEFSPTEELGRTMEVVTSNMRKMEAASPASNSSSPSLERNLPADHVAHVRAGTDRPEAP